MSGHKSGKNRGYEYDVDAWVQFHLLRLAAFHPDTTKGDLAILAEIIQRYKGEFGNGWASHDHLGGMAGVHKATVIRAKQNLERLGFITVISPGVRGRATVNVPNFDLVPQKGSIPATLSPETLGSTDATLNAELGSADATTTPELGSTDATPSYILSPAYKAEGQVYGNVSSPPAPDGLEATGRESGFEEAWAAYGKLGNKKASRAAWDAIGADAATASRIAERAESWKLTAKPGKHRMTFQKWLSAEKWDEADRRPAGTNDNKPKKAKQEPAPTVTPEPAPRLPIVETHIEIIKADMDGGTLRLAMKADGGEIVHDEIALESDNESTQREGQKRFGALQAAVDLAVDDPVELRGKRLVLVRDPYQTDFGYRQIDKAA